MLEISEFAEAQHGLVTREQLLGIGVTSSAIGRRAAAGSLHPLQTGVYAVGYRVLSQHGIWLGAALFSRTRRCTRATDRRQPSGASETTTAV